MSDPIPPTVTRDLVKHLPDSVRRVILATNGSGKPPKGWRETTAAMHLGRGRWLVPIERIEADNAE